MRLFDLEEFFVLYFFGFIKVFRVSSKIISYVFTTAQYLDYYYYLQTSA